MTLLRVLIEGVPGNREVRLVRVKTELKLMKRINLTRAAALLIATAALTVTSSQALTSIQIQEIKTAVLSVPVPEMPAKAASLVKSADKKDRQAVAITAVRAIVLKHKAAAPLVISAISKVAPELAPVVAAAGAEIATEQAATIANAAAVAAPAHAVEVSVAVGKAAPAQSSSVASAVNRSMTRASASQGPSGTGIITISDQPISPTGGTGGNFPLSPPTESPDPRVIYNQPPQ